MKKINEQAALKYAVSVLGEQESPVGEFDLGRVEIRIRLSDGASIERAEGSEGDGTEEDDHKPTLAMAFLVMKEAGLSGPTIFAIWKRVALRVIEEELKPIAPPEATKALEEINKELRDANSPNKKTKKTSAVCTGKKGVEITIERLTIEAHTKGLTTMKARH